MKKEAFGYLGFWIFFTFIIHEFKMIEETYIYGPKEQILFTTIIVAYCVYTIMLIHYSIKIIRKGGTQNENSRSDASSNNRNC